jgi:hypothetical protein
VVAVAVDLVWTRWARARWQRGLLAGLVVLLATFNLARTAVNFFIAHLKSGGRNTEMTLGSELESTNHFVRSDRLYHWLVSNRVKNVLAEFFVGAPLYFYDIPNHQLGSVILVEDLRPDDLVPAKLNVVAYSGGRRRLVPELVPEPLKPKLVIYQDEHFIIMR